MSDPVDEHLNKAIASLGDLTVRELHATAEALASAGIPCTPSAASFATSPTRAAKAGARNPRFHLRENVSRADEELAAQIADAPAPFWRQCAMRWPSGIPTSPPPFRKRSASFPSRTGRSRSPRRFLQLGVRIIERMSRSAQRRCFWSWPIGHKWEQVSDAGLTYRHCTRCGKREGGSGGGPLADRPHDRLGTPGG